MKTTTQFDPITQGRHSCGLSHANRLATAFKSQVVDAHARAVAKRMAEPVILVFDMADGYARALAIGVFGRHEVGDHLSRIDGGVRAGVRCAAVIARPCEAVRQWLAGEGEDGAASELSPASYPGNVVVLVATCGDVHQFHADRC